jgi:hypothetical protein
MPSLEDLENLALFGTGVGVGRSPRATGKAFVKAGRFAARRYPVGIIALGLYEAHKRGYLNRSDWQDAASELAGEIKEGSFLEGAEVGPLAAIPKVKAKRVVSKANKAMKLAMKATKNNFKEATKIASKANPNTKSKIGKGVTKAKKLARQIRKKIWGTLRRKK